ncbi:tetratricopeptide repeat protein [Roseibium sp.]|uniref:tetratricopeptide repeat protein n=1 Tax=Roseibium sp. TaxID=1936156 RepID=UPI003A9876AC
MKAFVRRTGIYARCLTWHSFVAWISRVCLLFYLGLSSLIVPASAQTVEGGTATLPARQQQLLSAMLVQPDNLDIAFEYASVSAQLGDFEAAVSTFERMLIFAPGLARVQLELGVLYYRIGASEMARQYFTAAISGPEVPEEVESRVRSFLTAIDASEETTNFQAMLLAGVRVQSNANAAPGGRAISLNGSTFLLDETSTGRADVNLYGVSTGHLGYDLGTQGDALEADFLAYGSHYRDVSRLDTVLSEVTFGPSLNLARFGIGSGRLGLYGIVSGVHLDYANYSAALGGGTRIALRPADKTELSGKLEFRRRWYNDTATNPTLSDRAGYQLKGNLTLTHQLTGALSARVTVLGDFEEAKSVWRQSWEIGGSAGATVQFASLLPTLPHSWSASLDVGYLHRTFQGADPVVSATEAQEDDEGFVRATLTVPLRSDFAVSVTGEYRRLFSNYDLSTYSDVAASVALIKTF